MQSIVEKFNKNKWFLRVVKRFPQLVGIFLLELPRRKLQKIKLSEIKTWDFNIPNNVYQNWQNDLFGKTHLKYLVQFRQINPEFNFYLFNDLEMDEFMNKHFSHHPIYHIYLNSKFPAMKVDIWRYCILYQNGGFYFDINKLTTTPLIQLLNQNFNTLLSLEGNKISTIRDEFKSKIKPHKIVVNQNLPKNEKDYCISNWGFAFTKKNELLLKIIDSIVTDYNSYKNVKFFAVREPIIEFTGPMKVTQVVHEFLLKKDIKNLSSYGIKI